MDPFYASKFLSFVRRCADNAILADERIRGLAKGENQRKGKKVFPNLFDSVAHFRFQYFGLFACSCCLETHIHQTLFWAWSPYRWQMMELSNIWSCLLCRNIKRLWIQEVVLVWSDAVFLETRMNKKAAHHLTAAKHEYRLFIEHPDQPNCRIFPIGCQHRTNASLFWNKSFSNVRLKFYDKNVLPAPTRRAICAVIFSSPCAALFKHKFHLIN